MTLDTFVDLDSLVSAVNASEAPIWSPDDATPPLYKLVQAITLYLIPVICGVGLLGGVASWSVFTCSFFRYQPCSHYLAVLTASDSGFLVALLMSWLTTIQPGLAASPGYCQVMVYMTYTCSFLSAWYLALLILERYITVCHPLHAPVLCTRRHARLAVGTVTLLALLLYLHSFFTTRWTRSSLAESPCQQEERHLHFLAVFTYVDFIVTFVLPFIIIFSLNLRIILAVRSFRKRHRHPLRQETVEVEDEALEDREGGRGGGGGGVGGGGDDGNGGGGGGPGAGGERGVRVYCLMSRAQVRATKLLVWVATVFLVLYLPSHALRLYLLIRVLTEGEVYSENLMLAQQICQFFYYINFAVDFFVFCVTSQSFRRNIARCLRRL